MMVMFPCRLAARSTVRPVSSEYRSKIWSAGALKNLRKCSAFSDWTAGAAAGAGLAGGPGSGKAGNATRFVPGRVKRLVKPGGRRRRWVSPRLVDTAGALVMAGPMGGAGRLRLVAAGAFVTPKRALVAATGSVAAGGLVAAAGFGAGGGGRARIFPVRSEKSRRAVFTILGELRLIRVTVWWS